MSDILQHDQQLSLVATVEDAIDGTTRLLCDVQRFGFRLTALKLDAISAAGASIRMTIVIPASFDPAQVLSRFARHKVVASLGPA